MQTDIYLMDNGQLIVEFFWRIMSVFNHKEQKKMIGTQIKLI